VITAARAAGSCGQIRPDGVVQAARCEQAAALLDDLRRIDTRIRETRKKLAVIVAAAGTSLTGPFGYRPGQRRRRHWRRAARVCFPGRDHLTPYNSTVPIGVSSGQAQGLLASQPDPFVLNGVRNRPGVWNRRSGCSRSEAADTLRYLPWLWPPLAAQLPGVRPALSTKGRLSGGALPWPAVQSPCNAGLRCSEASCRKEILL
jgi:hypothetical protein